MNALGVIGPDGKTKYRKTVHPANSRGRCEVQSMHQVEWSVGSKDSQFLACLLGNLR